MAEPMYSVIVPCWNVDANVGAQLDAIHAQVLDRGAEVIVVDDCSSDSTSDVAAKWAIAHPEAAITVVRSPRRGGPNRSRNVGALLARGHWLLYVDGDDVVLPGWFEEMSASIRSAPDSTIVTGVVVRPDGSRQAPADLDDGSPTVFGGNMAIARHTMLECQGFDETMFRGGTETEFVVRARRSHGLAVSLCEQAAILYQYPTTSSPFRVRAVRHLQRAKGHAYLDYRRRCDRSLQTPLTRRLRRSASLRTAVSNLTSLSWLIWYRMVRPSAQLVDQAAVAAYRVVHSNPPAAR